MEKIGAIADTGFVVALLNRKDHHHSAVATIYQHQPTIALPQPALTEIAYLLGRDAGILTIVQFLRSLDKSRFQVISLTWPDTQRVAQILEMYQDSQIDFVDACVMAIAERLNLQTVLTLDRRDFSIFRPQHCQAFNLLP
ncbi:PIN domain-containing protein [Spirulina major CS-329]|uniref:type II toxin-antitoxin system VapC family toxin n=1 Tax=Spirulina TaxID=1154 RepID=UPI00232C2379|nr:MULTISPECIES: PIN domain-containing protein [Spirulina]MDB9493769.1 PIN domain-containing protein [Spirulina subsalsa CS-330]MDB9503255.1 PIN domain-containing protein [Spirulina major CS-329]